jgi:hypothetical protein
MSCLLRAYPGFSLRDALILLTLAGHLFVTFGYPLFPPSRTSKETSASYPCQNRPCGCQSAEECWQGDCCCSTLEEKLAWAEDNGIEPPNHVRPLVESRKAGLALPKKSCCSELVATPSSSGSRSAPVCSQDGARPTPECCETKPPRGEQSGEVRWVLGLFARSCRGQEPAGFFQVDPAIVLVPIPVRLGAPNLNGDASQRWYRPAFQALIPPTPPPRSC